MSKKYVTAKEIEVSLKAGGSKNRKLYITGSYSRPLTVQSGSSFKTGKHGGSKTRLMATDWFNNQKLTLLIDSFDPFYDVGTDPRYFEQQILLLALEPNGLKVLTEDYQTLELAVSNLEVPISQLKEGDTYSLACFKEEEGTLYKLLTN